MPDEFEGTELSGDFHRVLGRLEGRQGSTEDRLDRIEAKVDQLVEFMQSAQGSWKTLVAVGSISSGITVAFLKAWAALKGGP